MKEYNISVKAQASQIIRRSLRCITLGSGDWPEKIIIVITLVGTGSVLGVGI